MKIRVKKIVELVDSDIKYLIDVGSDHCWLGIELLKLNKCQHIINIEKNKGPHLQGIHNIENQNLLSRTTNIINDGLVGIEDYIKMVDTIVIAGMGTNNIIDILEPNKVKFNQLIIQSNSDLAKLRGYIINDLKLKIINEVYVKENNLIYAILNIKNEPIDKQYSKWEIFFGRDDTIINKDLFFELLNNRLKYLLDNRNILINNQKLNNEYELINKRLKNEN